MSNEVVYMEFNNWFAGRDYPEAEPYDTWLGDDMHLYFSDENWVKENKLCVVVSNIDMSVNFCITALKSWVEENCPTMLSDESFTSEFISTSKDGTKVTEHEGYFKDFLRFPDEYGDVTGRFGCPFLEYSEENIGVKYWDEYNNCWYEDEENDVEKDDDVQQ